ncbi:hypothetical protein KCU61_g9637, partial [Aureobasidium melanogenum]
MQSCRGNHIGRSVVELPTPSLILSQPVIERNIGRMHQAVRELEITFRPHVKTLKALYGLPVYSSVLPELHALTEHLDILLMVDNAQHINLIETYNRICENSRPWRIFIKVDVGSRRSGLPAKSAKLAQLVKQAEDSSAVEIYGFYCHAGHSYACKSAEAVSGVLEQEIESVKAAAQLVSSNQSLILSIGATPTAHVIKSSKFSLPQNMRLELHAGNFPANDLQQLATGCIEESDQSIRVQAEICSIYPERNEAVVNAGCKTSDGMWVGYLKSMVYWLQRRMPVWISLK